MSTNADALMYELRQNSYRNFHARGVDYVCLQRSPLRTVKVYFFENECRAAPEVFCPHDHRYDFASRVLAGALSDLVWREDHRKYTLEGDVFQRFLFDTPLNGGGGFRWNAEVRLVPDGSAYCSAGGRYVRDYRTIHTLAGVAAGAVLLQYQYCDQVPVGVPTRTYSRDREPPSLSGLYEKHDPDQIVARLRQLEDLLPGTCRQYGLDRLLPAGTE